MKDDYRAYLLRLHRRQDRDGWRATLENAHTGEVRHFGSRTELLLHLLQVLNDDVGSTTQLDAPGSLE